MKSKSWFKSKGMWGGVLLCAYSIIGYALGYDFNVQAFLMGLSVIGIRQAQD